MRPERASANLQAAFNTHYSYRQGVLAARLRAAITVVVFRKALALNSATLAGVGTGGCWSSWEGRPSPALCCCRATGSGWAQALTQPGGAWTGQHDKQLKMLALFMSACTPAIIAPAVPCRPGADSDVG